jgi:Arc/MetJ-type ribon-helix-helix transcriptional regulator/ribosomal protein L32
MSKITFRADDELITRLEEFDASKSEIMREALREYLDTHGEASADTDRASTDEPTDDSLDDLVADRVDSLIADRLDRSLRQPQGQDVNVNITLDAPVSDSSHTTEEAVDAETAVSNDASNDVSHTAEESKTPPGDDENTAVSQGTTCSQCGENVAPSHVYCPNCGEKTSRRVFCDCGDEIRSDWAFCPGCGRRTPAADVLDNP